MRAVAGNVAAAVAAASLDDTVDATAELFLPSGAAPPSPSQVPQLCLILPGFLLSARRSYRTLAAHLASHGFPAALVDLDDPSASDKAAARATAAAAAACAARCAASERGAATRGARPPRLVMLVGHSRGAKVAALSAGEWERLAPARGAGNDGGRLAGLVLLDPVDRATLGPPPGPSYPSALPSVRALASRGVPILIVAAGDNADIVEPAAGWRAFSAAAEAGAAEASASSSAAAEKGHVVVELLLPRAKHLDFADTQSDPFVGGLLAVAGNIFGGAGGVQGGGANLDRPPGEAAAVRRCADAAAAFWAAVACGGGSVGPAAVEAEVAALRRLLVPDARARVIAWGARAGAGAGAAAAGVKARESDATQQQLLAMRASQLQAMLRERGVYYGDCFDKPSLVERVLASSSSSPGASAAGR